MPPSTIGSQVLPAKEQGLFRKIVKCYEQKQYRSGLRFAKQILSNPQFSPHGETMAMKGLILNCMGRHDEAMDVVKKGLTANLDSHICWHVFGLVQRSEKKYEEAMKAYKRALRIDQENLQILRDLSLLQVQMRDLEGYRDSRHQLLVLRPTAKTNWIHYANACHLLKEYDMALRILKDYRKNNRVTVSVSVVVNGMEVTDSPVKAAQQYDSENSELVLYEVMILREAGRPEFALTKLEENAQCVFDRVVYHEIRAELLIELGRTVDAEKVYWTLVERNPDKLSYYDQIAKCQGIDADTAENRRSRVSGIYDRAKSSCPRASLPDLLPLFCLEGNEFEGRLLAYLVRFFRKGVPSLFKNLVPLYSHPSKVAAIERVLLEFIRQIEENGYNKASLDVSPLPEGPTTVLWVYYYLAQHYDRLKNYAKALKYIDEALRHTPTLIELYMQKAKLLKHMGDYSSAADCAVQAQELDTADRYINSKCAKYMLRAGMIAEAEVMCSKFTREGVSASDSLSDMQCFWFEIESAKAFAKLGHYGEALKKCHQVERHFMAFFEDQFDFHSYCVRKMTLCSYVNILRFEDTLRNHRFYIEAAKLAAAIYVRMVEHPEEVIAGVTKGVEDLNVSEVKKMKRKANKAKAQEDKSKTGAQQQQNKRRVDGELDVIEPEPLDPEKLLSVKNPLEEAVKFIQPALQFPCKDADAYLVAFNVYYHRNKVLLMLQCLKRAKELDPSSPALQPAIEKCLEKCREILPSLASAAAELANELSEGLTAPNG